MNRKVLIVSLQLLALGALLLHMRIHPPIRDHFPLFNFPGFFATFIIGLDLLLVPYLLSFKETAALGFLLKGMIVILGIIIMAHFSLANLKEFTFFNLIFGTTLADVLMAFASFLVSQVIFDSYFE